MKYLLVIAVVFVFAWVWRASRTKNLGEQAQKKKKPADPVNMVACTRCGVHLPASDAVAGAKGTYCSVAHRQSAEP